MRFCLISIEQLVGKNDSALVAVHQHFLHGDVVEDWSALQAAAAKAGFDLAVVSAYRSFARQLVIWNEKVDGERPLLDANGYALDVATLDDKAVVFAILHWSALPGGSRHHWGTDIDVYDRAAVASDYAVQLVADEVNQGGVFAPLHDWLDSRINSDSANGFYRPYQGAIANGIAAERWHLSHGQTAKRFSQQLTAEVLYDLLKQETDMRLRDTVLANFDEIFARFIRC